jgi:hypothetical protein
MHGSIGLGLKSAIIIKLSCILTRSNVGSRGPGIEETKNACSMLFAHFFDHKAYLISRQQATCKT